MSAEHRTEETDTAPLGQVFFRDPFKLDLERLHVWLPYSHNLVPILDAVITPLESLSIQFGKWNDRKHDIALASILLEHQLTVACTS